MSHDAEHLGLVSRLPLWRVGSSTGLPSAAQSLSTLARVALRRATFKKTNVKRAIEPNLDGERRLRGDRPRLVPWLPGRPGVMRRSPFVGLG